MSTFLEIQNLADIRSDEPRFPFTFHDTDLVFVGQPVCLMALGDVLVFTGMEGER